MERTVASPHAGTSRIQASQCRISLAKIGRSLFFLVPCVTIEVPMRRRLFSLLALVLTAGVGLAAAPKPVPPPEMRVHFIDVGQGAATLLEFPCGAMLVDTGGEKNDQFDSIPALTNYLKAFFARRTDLKNTLDVVLLTHPHIDHVRGAPTVLQNFTVKNFVDNGQAATLEEAALILAQTHEFLASHAEIHTLSVGLDAFSIDGSPFTSPVMDPFGSCKGVDPKVEALWGQVHSDPGWGDDKYNKPYFENQNNHSVATRVDFGESSILITGDLETVAIQGMLAARHAGDLDVDIYEVGHHGSHNGTTEELMAAMTPEWAVMEMGSPNRKVSWSAWAYGHPRLPTVTLLENGVSGVRPAVEEMVASAVKTFAPMSINKAIFGTGWDGNVVLSARGDGHIERCQPDVAPTPTP